MHLHELLEKGRNFAERIPYSVVALAIRFAVADIFWRSGQTKVHGFSIREETFYLFREEYKVPLLPPISRRISVPSASMSSRFSLSLVSPRGFPRSACSV